MNKQVLGKSLMGLGVLCLILSGGLFFINEHESDQAEKSASHLVEQIHAQTTNPDQDLPADVMGTISIPKAGVELPVFDHWNEELLRQGVCRYFGSIEEGNLVLAGHNYRSGFGCLGGLEPGDEVILSDRSGNQWVYVIQSSELLEPTQVKEMIESNAPLTLYTCTYDGSLRITLRCALKEN